MTPLLDGVAINSRIDWQHVILPVQQPVMEENFPGVSQRFVRQGAKRPDDLVLIGFLEGTGATVGEAVTSLSNAFRALLAKRNDGMEHTVKIHNATWSSLILVEMGSMGGVVPVAAADGHKVLRRVQLAFSQLSDAFVEEAVE